MILSEFIDRYGIGPETVEGPSCLEQLLKDMALGLAGEGNIPMIPSYLCVDTRPVPGQPCCVLDAGGTNLRVARAIFDAEGNCCLSGIRKIPMPGTEGEMYAAEFYGQLARSVRKSGCPERVGLCFSYNVEIRRDLDGILLAWCKEVQVPDAPGKPVGRSLAEAVGEDCRSVRVLNDSTAALLGAHSTDPGISVGVILGTGINVCYSEQCTAVAKAPGDLRGESMIISTEIGEFRGIPKTAFEEATIADSDDPALAQAEKQCAGAYLGQSICYAWQRAVREGLLPDSFLRPFSLPEISDYVAGELNPIPQDPAAVAIARTMIHRAAKIAAILTAGPVIRSGANGSCKIVIEGSQFRKLTGFGTSFRKELDALLLSYDIRGEITEVENSCLIGAALAAFADTM